MIDDHIFQYPGPWFNIKMPSYQYRKSYCGDKTGVRSSYLHNGISYVGKMASFYWISPPIANHCGEKYRISKVSLPCRWVATRFQTHAGDINAWSKTTKPLYNGINCIRHMTDSWYQIMIIRKLQFLYFIFAFSVETTVQSVDVIGNINWLSCCFSYTQSSTDAVFSIRVVRSINSLSA